MFESASGAKFSHVQMMMGSHCGLERGVFDEARWPRRSETLEGCACGKKKKFCLC